LEHRTIETPVAQALPAGNGADGGDYRPPMLFGRITEAAGAPVPAANITIIDRHGHKLLRTSTDRDGRYAADALPEDVLTVLVSLPDRMPVATRVILTGGLPVRHDLVMPDGTQGTGAFA
jgi:Carboxypeptidase regulatory-like domain